MGGTWSRTHPELAVHAPSRSVTKLRERTLSHDSDESHAETTAGTVTPMSDASAMQQHDHRLRYLPLIAEHEAVFTRLFEQLDADHDGWLTRNEWRELVALYEGEAFDEAHFHVCFGPDRALCDRRDYCFHIAELACCWGRSIPDTLLGLEDKAVYLLWRRAMMASTSDDLWAAAVPPDAEGVGEIAHEQRPMPMAAEAASAGSSSVNDHVPAQRPLQREQRRSRDLSLYRQEQLQRKQQQQQQQQQQHHLQQQGSQDEDSAEHGLQQQDSHDDQGEGQGAQSDGNGWPSSSQDDVAATSDESSHEGDVLSGKPSKRAAHVAPPPPPPEPPRTPPKPFVLDKKVAATVDRLTAPKGGGASRWQGSLSKAAAVARVKRS